MSVESIARVLNHSRAKGTTKLVLIGIANHDGDGGSWPSVATLARYANTSERSVQRAIEELVDLGEVVVHRNEGGTRDTRPDRRPNRYVITIRDGVTPASPRSLDGVTPTAERGDTGDANGVTPVSPEPSLNHPEPGEARERATDPTPYDDLGGKPAAGLSLPGRCPAHAGVEFPPPCFACRDAREAADKAARRARLEGARREAEEAAAARVRAIAACSMCDDKGYQGAAVCHHDPTLRDTVRQGAAAVRAALEEARGSGRGRAVS